MNLQLKKQKRSKRVALGESDSIEKRSRKVSTLEQEPEPTSQEPVIRLETAAEPSGVQEWYEEVDTLPDAPNSDTYQKLSVAEFGAALRRGIGIAEDHEPEEPLKSHDHTGIGYSQGQVRKNSAK